MNCCTPQMFIRIPDVHHKFSLGFQLCTTNIYSDSQLYTTNVHSVSQSYITNVHQDLPGIAVLFSCIGAPRNQERSLLRTLQGSAQICCDGSRDSMISYDFIIRGHFGLRAVAART